MVRSHRLRDDVSHIRLRANEAPPRHCLMKHGMHGVCKIGISRCCDYQTGAWHIVIQWTIRARGSPQASPQDGVQLAPDARHATTTAGGRLRRRSGGAPGLLSLILQVIVVDPRLLDRDLESTSSSIIAAHLDAPLVLLLVVLEQCRGLDIGRAGVSYTPLNRTNLLGFGSLSRLCTLVRMAATSYVGDHRFCRMSRHSSPLL